MKLKLEVEVVTGQDRKVRRSGPFEADSRSLSGRPAALVTDTSNDPDRSLNEHLAGLPTEWARDFLRSL